MPHTLSSLLRGLRNLFRKTEAERDLRDEVEHYVEEAAAEKVRHGMAPAEAMRVARIEFGGVEGVKEEVRAARWEVRVESVTKDARYALRSLQRAPVYALTAIAILALGIGVNSAMFSIVNAVILRPLPYGDATRLVMVWTDDARRGLHREGTAHRTIAEWRNDTQSFDGLAYFSTQRASPVGNDPASPRERSRSAFVSGNLFKVLDVRASQGRAITEDDEAGREPVIVISHLFWQRHFGGATDVIGKPLVIDDAARGGPGTFTVIGIMPAAFSFPDRETELWMPATVYWRFNRESTEWFPQWARRWTAVARLRPSTAIDDAAADLRRLGDRQTALHRSTEPDFPGFATTVVPMLEVVAGRNVQSALWLLLGAVGLVLLAACANLANLMLARGAARQREFAIRRALGAGRARLVRQLLCESLIVSIAGGLAALALAVAGTRVFAAMAASFLPRMDGLVVDGAVLAFTAGASVLSGLVFGAAPAWRLSVADANSALREGSRGTPGMRVRGSHQALVLIECALAIVLLAGAGLLVRSLIVIGEIDAGFDPSHVLTMRLEFPSEPPPTAEERLQTSQIAPARARGRSERMRTLVSQIQAVAGVEHAAMTSDLFISGQANDSITIPGMNAETIAAGELNEGSVSPGFFAAFRVPLRKGRLLTDADTAQKIRALWSPVVTHLPLDEKERRATPEPVVVNEAFVHRFFPGSDPIGRRFCIDPTNKTYWYEIVGIVGDMHRQGLEKDVIPEYFGPYLSSPNARADLVVRTTGDPLAMAAAIRRLVTTAIPGVSIPSITTAEAGFGGFTAGRRLQTGLLTLFAALAVLLAGAGIFGLVHYAVSERTREIGVRMAMGATRRDVTRMVIGQGMRMPLIGIAIGLVAAAGVTRLLSSQLFHVNAIDVPTFAIIAVILAVVAFAACYFPARRASRIDPMTALRIE